MGSSPAERAADIHAAFADPGIAAVIASIGGAGRSRPRRPSRMRYCFWRPARSCRPPSRCTGSCAA
jgi:hypothetical protein